MLVTFTPAAVAPTTRARPPRPRAGGRAAARVEVLRLVGHGLSNSEIARRAALRMPTVKNHVRRVLLKLQVSTREEAATVARTARL